MNTSSATIKNLITDQDFIRGLGNAYTDEILWEARINPYSVASAIPDDKTKALAKAIKSVLKHGIKYIEKHHTDNITGEIRDFLKVHNNKKKESPNGYEIKKEKKGGSNTYYTEEQELYI
jgi:formamidopyrimidine-DNA glycosylase